MRQRPYKFGLFQSTYFCHQTMVVLQVLLPDCDDDDDDDEVDEPDGTRQSLGLRGGPCGDVNAAEASDTTSEDDGNPLSTSLEAKYFSQSFHQEPGDSDDGWNHCPDNLELEFQQGWFLMFAISLGCAAC